MYCVFMCVGTESERIYCYCCYLNNILLHNIHTQSHGGFLPINYIFVPQMSGICEMRFISAAYSLSLWSGFIWCGYRLVGRVDGFILYSCAESSLDDCCPWYHSQLNSSFGAVSLLVFSVTCCQYFNQFLQFNM